MRSSQVRDSFSYKFISWKTVYLLFYRKIFSEELNILELESPITVSCQYRIRTSLSSYIYNFRYVGIWKVTFQLFKKYSRFIRLVEINSQIICLYLFIASRSASGYKVSFPRRFS